MAPTLLNFARIIKTLEGTNASPNLASALDSISCLALSRYFMLGKWMTYWSPVRRKRCPGGPPALKLSSSSNYFLFTVDWSELAAAFITRTAVSSLPVFTALAKLGVLD